MGKFLDSVPVSAIVRIRDMMYTVKDPFRLDQGDVSFDAPDTFKQAVAKAMADNRTHYLPSTGIPPLRKAFAEKMRKKNGIPIGSDEDVIVTNGGTHALFAVFQAILEPGDEVIIPDPEWPPTMAIAIAAGAKPIAVPLHESLGWRWDIDEVERAITRKTRAIYINSPNNPTGGVLTRADLERLGGGLGYALGAAQPARRNRQGRAGLARWRHRAPANPLGEPVPEIDVRDQVLFRSEEALPTEPVLDSPKGIVRLAKLEQCLGHRRAPTVAARSR